MAGLAGVGRWQAPNVRTCLVTFGDLASAGPGAEPYEGALEEGADQLPLADVPEELPAFVMYTSGTTGRPKGAVLTHFNLLMNTLNMIVGMGIQDDDRRGLSGLPLFHTGGLNGILPYLLPGGTSVILPSGQFDAEQVVDMREAERSRPATSCRRSGRPSVPCRAVPGLADRDLSALRRISWGPRWRRHPCSLPWPRASRASRTTTPSARPR